MSGACGVKVFRAALWFGRFRERCFGGEGFVSGVLVSEGFVSGAFWWRRLRERCFGFGRFCERCFLVEKVS